MPRSLFRAMLDSAAARGATHVAFSAGLQGYTEDDGRHRWCASLTGPGGQLHDGTGASGQDALAAALASLVTGAGR
jgi:hypothetical protein